jgi:hypothetical protein
MGHGSAGIRHSILLALTSLTMITGLAMAQESLVATSPGVTVSNPNLLPPPGSGAGWIDHPCSHELRYDIEGTVAARWRLCRRCAGPAPRPDTGPSSVVEPVVPALRAGVSGSAPG